MKQNTLAAAIVAGMLLLTVPVLSNAELVSDTDAGKATMSKFMINLAKFVTWPDSTFGAADAPYKYCLMGDDAIGAKLDDAMSGKQTKKRSFDIQRLGIGDVDAAKACHVVFVNTADASSAVPLIDALSGLPVLTVGEADKFAQHGGMVGFYGKGRKVALAINQKRLEAAGLNASSKLYRASTM